MFLFNIRLSITFSTNIREYMKINMYQVLCFSSYVGYVQPVKLRKWRNYYKCHTSILFINLGWVALSLSTGEHTLYGQNPHESSAVHSDIQRVVHLPFKIRGSSDQVTHRWQIELKIETESPIAEFISYWIGLWWECDSKHKQMISILCAEFP